MHPHPHKTEAEIFRQVYQTFSTGIRSAKAQAPREYLKSLHLDFQTVQAAFSSGQTHHRKPDSYIAELVRIGLLRKSMEPQQLSNDRAYTVFGAYGIIFPLFNEQKEVCNFFAIRIGLQTPAMDFLNEAGLYPEYPKPFTRRIFVTATIPDAAVVLQSGCMDNREAVVSLFDGRVVPQHESVWGADEVEEIVCVGVAPGTVRTLEQQFPAKRVHAVVLPEETPHIIDLWKLRPDAAHMNALLRSYQPEDCEEAPKKPAGLVQLMPQKLSFEGELGQYQVLGNLPADLGKMTVTVLFQNRENGKRFRKRIDLFDGAQITIWSLEMVDEGINSNLFEADVLKLTDQLDQYREMELQKQQAQVQPMRNINLTPTERERAMRLLTAPDMLSQIDGLIAESGVVREEKIRLLLYVAATTCRNEDAQLQVVIQGTSGSGKSHLVNAIAACLPAERVMNITRVTSKSLYNFTGGELCGVCLTIQDLDGIPNEALLALRELQSFGEVLSATTFKDKQGNLQSVIRKVEGAFSSISATTKDLYYDNESRSILVGVDESEEQTLRIIQYQNNRIAGLIDTARQMEARNVLQNMLRLLVPLPVVNPLAAHVFLPTEARMLRRLNMHFQLYVRQIAWLHQFQRQRDEQGRIIVQKEDVRLGVETFLEAILLKVDELHHSLRHFYEQLKTYLVKQDAGIQHQFTPREIRFALRVSKTHLFRHFSELLKLEYIQVVGGNSNRGYVYRLVFSDNQDAVKERLKAQLLDQLESLDTDGTPNQLNTNEL